jgi:TRAP transporter TAXI family solute receptor
MTLRNVRRAVLAAALATASALPAAAEVNDNGPINYIVDGGTASGYFKVVAEAINGIIREVYPGSAATYKPGSPAGGILNISKGQSDFSFTGGSPEIAYALEGKAPYTESLKGKFQFVMLVHNRLVVHSLMTKEWADRNGITSFADIAAKKPQMRLAVNQIANLQSTLGMSVAIFDAYGIKEDEITKNGSIFRGNSASGMDAMRDGKIDVFINGNFVPSADVTDASRGRPLLWVSGEPDKIKAAADRWNYETLVVPKDAYPFLTKDEPTVTLWNVILAGAHVPEETVYKMLKALSANVDRVRSIHPSLANFSVEAVSRNSTQVPYHPGAARFYREAGVLK